MKSLVVHRRQQCSYRQKGHVVGRWGSGSHCVKGQYTQDPCQCRRGTQVIQYQGAKTNVGYICSLEFKHNLVFENVTS